MNFNTYSPVHSLCHREEVNSVEDFCQTLYNKFWFFFLLLQSCLAWDCSLTCICKSYSRNSQVSTPACNWMRIPPPANHTHFNRNKSNIWLHVAIFIQVHEWVGEWMLRIFLLVMCRYSGRVCRVIGPRVGLVPGQVLPYNVYRG